MTSAKAASELLLCQRDAFSLPPDLHYLNCAYMSPLPKLVEEAGMRGMIRKRDPSALFPGDFFKASGHLAHRLRPA